MSRCPTCPRAADAGPCRGEIAPRLCELARTRDDYRAHVAAAPPADAPPPPPLPVLPCGGRFARPIDGAPRCADLWCERFERVVCRHSDCPACDMTPDAS